MFPGSVGICFQNAPFHENPVMGFGASTRSINDGNPIELRMVVYPILFLQVLYRISMWYLDVHLEVRKWFVNG